MRVNHWVVSAMAFVCGGILVGVVGCAPAGSQLIAKGEVLYASFREGEGKISGWTSINEVKSVPGGNGSWNDHRYVELHENYLIVTKPGEKNWGTLIIPTTRLVEIHFAGQ
jgi:hypothetical protein